MKDKNGAEIGVGALVKRCGYVRYADGLKYKVSKKTWVISTVGKNKHGEDALFYKDENGNEVTLASPKNEGAFLVVGDSNGFFPEHTLSEKIIKITSGGVGQKYRVHGDVKERDWKDGDIVLVHGDVSKETIASGKLERVPDSIPHKHLIIVADPIKVFGKVK